MNILHVKAIHNICAADIILLAETRLIPNDNTNEYLIPKYEIPYQNDQILDTPTRPSHGMISYVRTPVRVLEKHKWSDAHFEVILLCVQHTVLPLLVQVIGVYLSPQCKFSAFTNFFDHMMRNVDNTSHFIILGDYNMKSITNLDHHYNKQAERYMRNKYHLQQIVTYPTTNHNSILDLCFANVH